LRIILPWLLPGARKITFGEHFVVFRYCLFSMALKLASQVPVLFSRAKAQRREVTSLRLSVFARNYFKPQRLASQATTEFASQLLRGLSYTRCFLS